MHADVVRAHERLDRHGSFLLPQDDGQHPVETEAFVQTSDYSGLPSLALLGLA
ncbi:hypothetical protein [Methylobacterium sp.]|uniref:hypothetical protein n=1 Tax=Methylobacterium sp. TaxID=409 RepID=UPI003B001A4E